MDFAMLSSFAYVRRMLNAETTSCRDTTIVIHKTYLKCIFHTFQVKEKPLNGATEKKAIYIESIFIERWKLSLQAFVAWKIQFAAKY